MVQRRIQLTGSTAAVKAATSAFGVDTKDLRAQFRAVRAEQEVPERFPDEVLVRAEWAADHVRLPERDETALPFFTIDPAESMDLDQALHLSRDGDGYRIRYAIAHLPAVVSAGDAVDVESWRRGQTIYAPDGRTPLHPPRLSEAAASLLPGGVRAAYVWDLRLATDGQVCAAEVYPARVRSAERLDYEHVQRALDGGSRDERFGLLREVGLRRLELEQARGGASLPMPEQEVTLSEDGRYQLRFRPPLAVEDWNAQISLLTGMAAAKIMLDAKVGILRTMPPPDEDAVRRLRMQARALGVGWPTEMAYGAMLRSLDRADPGHLALIHEAASLFRGAGYTPFEDAVPFQVDHAAVAAPYAHVTAPLRRLVDRFGLEVCAAVCRGSDPPGWVRDALPKLPEVMRRSDMVASAVERGCTDAVEAAVLRRRVGEVYDAVVVDVRRNDLLVQLPDPAVLAKATGHAQAGDEVQVRLTVADVAGRSVRFEVVR